MHLGGVMQGNTCLAFAFSYSLIYALSKYIAFFWYLEYMSQVNFKVLDICPSRRANAAVHMFGIYGFIFPEVALSNYICF